MNVKLISGAAMVAVLLLMAIAAPLIAAPYATDLGMRLQPPGEAGFFGTDHLGRDVFSRVIYGARLSVAVSLITLAVSMLIGVTLGLAAGYFGGICDDVIMFVIEVLLAFPAMVLSLAIVAIAGAGIFNAAAAVSLVSWTHYARMVRGTAMSLKGQDYIVASRISCASDMRIIFRHILPNLINPVIIYSAANISSIIMQLAALSFLGLGVQPPTAEWGAMLNDARGYITTAPWLIIAPSAGLVFMITGFNLLGEGLKE